MCGIVGHVGKSNSINIVLEGLRRLEYRGYDSAGISFKNEEGILSLHKKSGKLQNLEKYLKENVSKLFSNSCIGHTRWATHGKVNDTNAHPHLSDSIALHDDNSIAIVHNGIIENAFELKNKLIEHGLKFNSETDSEVFLGLLVLELNRGKKVEEAINNSFKQIDGNSAFVIQVKGRDEIFAVKRGAPLVCGINNKKKEVFVSSDPYALAGFVDDLFFPEDSVVAILNAKNGKLLKFTELDGTPSARFVGKKQEISPESAEKQGYEHFMLKEIHEQPYLIRALHQYYSSGPGFEDLKKLANYRPNHIHIVACGTAWHAGLVIGNYVERYNRIPCSVELASEFRYRDPLIHQNDLGIFISQSGETADTLAAQALCKEKGIRTLGIVNVDGSTLFRNCDDNLLIRAGIEIGVASTKAFTLQVLTGYLFAYALSNQLEEKFKLKKFELLATRIEEVLKNSADIKQIAEDIYNYKGFIFTGRGSSYPIALEGALKLKEIAYVHAEGYAAGELKHGPIALIDEQMVNIAIVTPKLYEKLVSNIQEVKARRGVILTLGPIGDRELEKMSDYYVPIKYDDIDEFAPVYINVVNQLLSYSIAKFKGTDIDKPRNLAKSVTVE